MTDNITADQLRAYVERVERLETERQDIAENIKEVFAEAKANGFDTKIMRQLIKMRGMDPADRAEQESLLDLYMRALGMKGEEE